jgi:hypothetical protein
MKTRECSILIGLVGLFTIRILSSPLFATLSYILISYLLRFDSQIVPIRNYHGQVEDGLFSHVFTSLSKTYDGLPVNITYHSVECGKGEPIVFFHGIIKIYSPPQTYTHQI